MAPEPYRKPAERPVLPDAVQAASQPEPVATPQDTEQGDVACGTWLDRTEQREPRDVGRYVYAAIVVLVTTLFVLAFHSR